MFTRLAIPEVFLFTPARVEDARGVFTETFNRALLEPMSGAINWVQDNSSRSHAAGTVRGLHLQIGAFAQDKLVACTRGSILDVAVDVRRGSPTFGAHVCARLSEENGTQMFVPRGFAHGFITCEPNCQVTYKVSNYYNPDAQRCIRWNDPALGIDWGEYAAAPTLSARDAQAPLLAQCPAFFHYP